MIVLKQVIHDPIAQSLEATWVDRTVAPDTQDEDGLFIEGATL